MATMIDVGSQRRSFLLDPVVLQQLPPELLDLIRRSDGASFLDLIAKTALSEARLTRRIFAHFETVFVDISARWVYNTGQQEPYRSEVVAAFARILPFAPYLSPLLRQYLPRHSTQEGSRNHDRLAPFSLHLDSDAKDGDDQRLITLLVSVLRLLQFDFGVFSPLVQLSQIQQLLSQPARSFSLRYVAAKLLSCLLSASDSKLESLLETFSDGSSLVAELDGQQIDCRFLSLHESSQAAEFAKLRLNVQGHQAELSAVAPFLATIHETAINYDGTLLPRLVQSSSTQPMRLTRTRTTISNLSRFAKLLHLDKPILLHGPIGSGKTALLQEVARELGKDTDMVTLHLNEQTDAKMLIGLYTALSKPGTFEWRPGVLTTAVEEGRWVLVEDLDRAPSEVVSMLLPLIERRELLMANRGHNIQAHVDFRLFATIRTSVDIRGEQKVPALLGLRHWQLLDVRPQENEELKEILAAGFNLLPKFVPMILSVYQHLASTMRNHTRSLTERHLSLRDLLKWCRRLQQSLASAGHVTGEEAIDDTTRERMYLDAVDCFTGHVRNRTLRLLWGRRLGQDMHLSPERVEYILATYEPAVADTERRFVVGRVALRKSQPLQRPSGSKRPFAVTTHAKRLLEQISMAVFLREPVLLVGETGIGKTAVVQKLAETLGHKLVAINLSQQSEVNDLLGGFKPVNIRTITMPLKEEFEDLFALTRISADKNHKYLEKIAKRTVSGKWREVSKLWRQAPQMFEQLLQALRDRRQTNGGESEDHPGAHPGARSIGPPSKRRKTEETKMAWLLGLKPRWDAFEAALDQLDIQLSGDGKTPFAFAFIEGPLVKAVRQGNWVLLDEINLASPDTLESIADLFQSEPGNRPSILLSETGSAQMIEAHPDFRIFAAMNPATDVGKRDLPPGIRSRFTELYVSSPDDSLKDLRLLCGSYLKGSSVSTEQAANNLSELYMKVKTLAEEKGLVDGANEVPHYSLRTLTRVLTYANDVRSLYGLERALYEGFCMCFLTILNQDSERVVMPLIKQYLVRKHGLLTLPVKQSDSTRQYVKFMNTQRTQQYLVLKGDQDLLDRADYIITPYVERNLLNLVRATSTRRFPVLIQGPTSSGKTSMIEYLANFSGNKFVRINNHEHTDLQEYLGAYVSGSDGRLSFQDGLLVQAMRHGYWIVLDELNLAPTDVLEALNRLLDDNRELLVPETQEVVRPHENFMLFATQNPPGLYGGRNILSRAFRNRFLELHFDDIPGDELETILQQRAKNTAPSDCKRIVTVYKELSRVRQTSRIFEQKQSFATLRDLFRWALRNADSREELATNGFMLLAERVRDDAERDAVKNVVETVFKVKISPDALYDMALSQHLRHFSNTANTQGVVWTSAMRRLYVLVANALANNEPVLLVGETGGGKTTVCQLLAEALGKELHIVNAHQNTETGDLIGSQRPIRNRGAAMTELRERLQGALKALGVPSEGSLDDLLQSFHAIGTLELQSLPQDVVKDITGLETRSKALFEWADGSLVHAMKQGQLFLLDEISLADDSVLERLNSVLEPSRSLLLAEKGVNDSFVRAVAGFQFLATMNPGGDFGKKELSPALRNRFTEIWVPPLSDREDVLHIVRAKLDPRYVNVAEIIVAFTGWFGTQFRSSSATAFSVRDILVWVDFINGWAHESTEFALVHGAATVFIDTLGANPSALISLDPRQTLAQRQSCLDKLSQLIGRTIDSLYWSDPAIAQDAGWLRLGFFGIPISETRTIDMADAFRAPTTRLNGMRVARALGLNRPILLEGSPGVGKTTLVGNLARACGMPLTRINLSDQTDLMDLFGSDIPVEGAEAGNFAWRDAPFLRAMQNGEWVLLDEMNLASQSVLEGLNACLDHRGEVYISELDQVFKRHPDFRLFAAQNPHHQGGGRKGLPSSFVNRFIVVYVDIFSEEDLRIIAQTTHPAVDADVTNRLINLVSSLDREVTLNKSFGSLGSPWEFNLRDTLRWLSILESKAPFLNAGKAANFLDVVVRQRFRAQSDRDAVKTLFIDSFGKDDVDFDARSLYHDMSTGWTQVGLAMAPRNLISLPSRSPQIDNVSRLREIESIMLAVDRNLPCVLVGPSGVGKSTLLEHVAASLGKKLVVFPMNAEVDAMDLVGGFEQSDPQRDAQVCLQDLREILRDYILEQLPGKPSWNQLLLFGQLMREEASVTEALMLALNMVRSEVPPGSTIGNAMTTAMRLLQRQRLSGTPRFEWLDSLIVKTVQKGDWLVLDNANLCGSSVLDRLNSLLERPDGHLSINEHSGPGGEPRIIVPHPDFRIFLTMDPRYGELSRAMRNRSVEIYLIDVEWQVRPYADASIPVEPWLRRFEFVARTLRSLAGVDPALRSEVLRLALGTLGLADVLVLKDLEKTLASSSQMDDSFQESFRQEVHHLLQVFPHFKTALYTTYASSMSFSPATSPNSTDIALARNTKDWIERQPVYPLSNTAWVEFVHKFGSGHDLAWLASGLELFQDIQVAEELVRSHVAASTGSRSLSTLTRLQRSSAREAIPVLARDTTARAYPFLVGSAGSLQKFMTPSQAEPGGTRAIEPSGANWLARRKFLRRVLVFWKKTADILCSSPFEDVIFQINVGQGRKLLGHASDVGDDMGTQDDADVAALSATLNAQLEHAFGFGFKLNTGLSMEELWKVFRPELVRKAAIFEALGQITALGARFDAVKWRIADGSVDDLQKAISTLCSAYAAVFRGINVADLITELDREITGLETSAEAMNDGRLPQFAEAFDGLQQLSALNALPGNGPGTDFSSQDATAVFSDLSVVSQMHLQGLTTSTTSMQTVERIMARPRAPRPWDGTLVGLILRTLGSSEGVQLSALDQFETELVSLKQGFVTSSAYLADEPLVPLGQCLQDLLCAVVKAHGITEDALQALYQPQNFTSDSLEAIVVDSMAQSPETVSHFKQIMQSHFRAVPVLMGGTETRNKIEATALAAVAWAHFAVGCLKLYVPDKAFDPYLRAKLDFEFAEEVQHVVLRKLSASRRFDELFTGKGSTSVRTKMLQKELEQLPPLPESGAAIYRPPRSELQRLQGEFTTVMQTVVQGDVVSIVTAAVSDSEGSTASEQVELIAANVGRLIDRLSNGYRGYQDLTTPAVGFLRCLQIGLSLARNHASESGTGNETNAMLSTTPFMGASLSSLMAFAARPGTFECLSLLHTTSAIDAWSGWPPRLRRFLTEAFHSFHDDWAVQLEKDKKEEEQRQSLYRFRGSLEDEEEVDEAEFSEMFPTYGGEEGHDGGDDQTGGQGEPMKQSARADAVRDLSVKVASWHQKIFGASRDAQQAIAQQIELVGKKAVAEMGPRTGSMPDGANRLLFPAALLALDRQIREVSIATMPASYNFYTDSNLAEARTLVRLVQKVRRHFKKLQAIDEIGHLQPIADVVTACDKLLQVPHSEPLSKLIAHTEQLHACVYEWEVGGWASRVHGAPDLYTQLTDTLVSWRRLELSTWAKLFDMELERCRQDAYSWWFIAYGITIVEPLRRLRSGEEDLTAYTVDYIASLRTYLADSMLGQYSTRLQVLSQLREHLSLLSIDFAELTVIRDALATFISLHSMFEDGVQADVQLGRKPIEKAMKDVLLLASWKDTNIVALRESARKSHLKLFRLVRKFRAVLGRPVKTVLDRGLPETVPAGDKAKQPAETNMSGVIVSQQALATCETSFPGWLKEPQSKRLSDAQNVVSTMERLASQPSDAIAPADVLDEFVGDLSSSMAALRKETPPFLTEENKDAVKHLKSRKVKLFTETLKAMRQMGFSRSLSEAVLGRQASMAALLTASGELALGAQPPNRLAELDAVWGRVVDLAPRVRASVKDHAPDLSREAINRSTGYLEGVLSVALQQRKALARAGSEFDALDRTVAYLERLGQEEMKGKLALEKRPRQSAQTLRWLVEMLRFAATLIDLQCSAGERSTTEKQRVDAAAVVDGWLQQFRDLLAKAAALPELPEGIISQRRIDLDVEIETKVQDFSASLDEMMLQRRDLVIVLSQIKLWARVTSIQSHLEDSSNGGHISALHQHVLTTSSLVLDAVQKYNKEVKTLPTSTEEASWLVNHVNGMQKAVRSLNMTTIGSAITSLFDTAKATLDEEGSLQHQAWALLAVLLPFAQQYRAISANAIRSLADLHVTTCKMSCFLGKSFIQLASHGFCTPQEKSDDKSKESGKMETDGTGLGEGQGAEDISKDIQPDEDLSELAQQQPQPAEKEEDGEKDGIEDQADAVDMDGEEMEGGELGSLGGESDRGEDGEDEDGRDDLDEEAADVDELDPTAVDEKIWSGKDQEAEKEKEGQQAKGEKAEDEDEMGAAAAAGDEQEQPQAGGDEDAEKVEKGADGEDEGDEDEAGMEQDENVRREDGEVQDPRAEEKEALELPDDMQLDANENGDVDEDEDDDDLEGLSDVDGGEHADSPNRQDDLDTDLGSDDGEPAGAEQDNDGQQSEDGEQEEEEALEDTVQGEEAEDPMDLEMAEDEAREDKYQQEQPSGPDENNSTNPDQAVQSDERGGNGGQDELDVQTNDADDKAQSQATSRQRHGEVGSNEDPNQETSGGGQEGALSQANPSDQDKTEQGTGEQPSATNQSLRKLGDAWERWYRNNKDILEAQGDKKPKSQQQQQQNKRSEADMARSEFQHLQDEDAEVDAQQALGAAKDDEVRPIDDLMAIDDERDGGADKPHLLPDEMDLDEEDDGLQDADAREKQEQDEELSHNQARDAEESRKGVTMMQGGKTLERDDDATSSADDSKDEDDRQATDREDKEEEDIEETSTQLSTTHLTAMSSTTLRPYAASLKLWTDYQARTHALSLSLTSQLRLILTPSQSTKLSGAHRTGKRLNIKKIIPYIASGYRRDKIWLRRSVPTKRAYQILLCVDDSKSMGEQRGGSSSSTTTTISNTKTAGTLALESLVMVARALAMLEAGSIGVLGFGDRVFAAHDLVSDSSSGSSTFGTNPDAGARALQHFTFGADRTDVVQLMRSIMDRFRAARLQQASHSAKSLWQLALILSDGLTPSSEHEAVRRLLRTAAEERVMCVFVILDDGSQARKGDSVLELKEASFVKDASAPGGSRVVVERYLDSFPFPYYLIVHHLDDLPGALAGVLRTWFAEVNS